MIWDYNQPVSIVFGSGRLKDLPELIKRTGGKKGILVTTEPFASNGTAKSAAENSDGLIAEIFTDVSPNPDVTEVDKCASVIREKNIDFVVAMGGGSVMDCAKAASAVCLTDNSIREYHGTGKTLPNKALPLIAVPTTSGTGSEVTCVSVLTDHAAGKKAPIVSDTFFPAFALIDPELTVSMPPKLTAICGLDVLCHAVEGYWSKGHQPICDACAIYAAKLVFENVLKAYQQPENLLFREKMAEASVIAGLSFTLPKTTSSHACSFPLTNLYGIPHGEACALTLDYFAKVNAAADGGRVLKLARELGFEDVTEMSSMIYTLKKAMGLRVDLKDLNLTDADIDELVRISHHPNMLNNPVEITDEILYDMYNSMR